MNTPKRVMESKSIMTEMIMPNDTNSLGNLMGGNLMRWMDIAAAICANRHAERYCVTVSVDHLSFKLPIPLGHVITLEANVTRSFHTSMEVHVKVSVSDSRRMDTEISNHAFFTFVALDELTQKPTEVPGVIPETETEKQLYESAMLRREMRLLLSGRLGADKVKVLKEVLEGKNFFIN